MHHIFQRQHITPGEFYSYGRGEQAFMLASTIKWIEDHQNNPMGGGDLDV